MISYKTGNILSDDSEVLVNTVNCVGVMGRGVALQFKQAFPDNFRDYAAACKRGEVQPGRMFVHRVPSLGTMRFIVNFPTKRHWRGASRMEDIESGLLDLVRFIREERIRSIAVPPLGAGLGGLDWPQVRRRIEGALAALPDVTVTVYEPNYVVDTMPAPKNRVARMTAGRASLISLIDAYLRGLVEPDITLLEIHKLMFFLQESGQPLRLNFVKAPHGPYAENLRHVLIDTEGTFTSGYLDGGDSPDKKITLLPGAVDEAALWLDSDSESRSRLDRVVESVAGFETPVGLELLATVYWLMARNPGLADDDLLKELHAWSPAKTRFDLDQVSRAREHLTGHSWA